MILDKMKNKYENLSIFINKLDFKYYLTPGPMKKEGNTEFCIGVKKEEGNKKLVTNTKEKIHEMKEEMRIVYNDIKNRKTVYFVPSGSQYHFGVMLREDEKKIEINFAGRPNNAVGSGLNFLKAGIIKDNFDNEKILDFIEKILKYYGRTDYVQKFYEKLNGVTASYKKEKPLIHIENINKLNLRSFNSEINKQAKKLQEKQLAANKEFKANSKKHLKMKF